jgi:hypothetical protein
LAALIGASAIVAGAAQAGAALFPPPPTLSATTFCDPSFCYAPVGAGWSVSVLGSPLSIGTSLSVSAPNPSAP